MDFVVVGLGVGALAILLGLTSREAGSRWWPLRRDQPVSATERARRLAIGRAGRAGGLVLCLAGGAIVVATIIALGLSLSDQAGAILVMATISAAVLGGVAWASLYVARYHPRPLPRAPSRRPAPESWPDDASPALAGTMEAGPAREGGGLAPVGELSAADGEPDEPAASASLGIEPAAEPLADDAGRPPGAAISASADAADGATEPGAAAESEPPATEPEGNGDGPRQTPGYAISSKNQLV